MRFRLRTLLIAVALFGLIFGGRVEHLRRQAAFHANEAIKSSDFGDYLYHDQFAKNYRYAICRPWSIVKAPPPASRGDK